MKKTKYHKTPYDVFTCDWCKGAKDDEAGSIEEVGEKQNIHMHSYPCRDEAALAGLKAKKV